MKTKLTYEETVELARRFAKMIHEQLDPQAEVYLFGSAARKEHNDSSDIDIAVVSKVFTNNIITNGLIVDKLAYALSSDIDAQAIIIDDWVNTTPFTADVKNEGVLVSQ